MWGDVLHDTTCFCHSCAPIFGQLQAAPLTDHLVNTLGCCCLTRPPVTSPEGHNPDSPVFDAGEAQKIDRIMERFAERYCKDNPDAFKTSDGAYLLSFALIMLNTDAHNPMADKKLSLEDFISMCQYQVPLTVIVIMYVIIILITVIIIMYV